MSVLFLIIVLLHGLIHLLGFIKGVGFKEVKELTLFISKPMAYVWLSATILLLIYGILYSIHSKYAWFFGLVAVFVSQILVFVFWKDAKFGTIPNVLIFVISISLLGYFSFQKRVQRETQYLLNQNQNNANTILSENDLQTMPEPVKKWLRNSGSIGKPFIHSGKVTQNAEMLLKPGQKNWLSATAIQYTAVDNPAFIWKVDVKMNRFLNIQGRDKFENGKGEMLIKMNSLINIVNEQGEPLDEGTLQRYLGEMVWFPSLALSPYIVWEAINDTAAKATMTYKGTTGSGTFFFNNHGEVTTFSALRFKENNVDAKRHEWTMNISAYKTFEGIKVPAKMTSTWKLDEGDWTWLKLEVMDINYNKNTIE